MEVTTPEGKVYFCSESESDMTAFIKNLQAWIDYFVSEVSSAARDAASSQTARGFSISNSERQNAQNLKGYYASLRRDGSAVGLGGVAAGSGGASAGASAARTGSASSLPKPSMSSDSSSMSDPKQQIVEIDSPARGGMYRSASGRDLQATMGGMGLGSGGAALASQTPRKETLTPELVTGSAQTGILPTERIELQREEINALTMRLKQALDAESAYRREIDQLKQSLSEKDLDLKKQLEEMNTSFEAKKRSFNFIVNSKDFEIEKLRQEKQKLSDAKIKELEDLIALRDREITELKSKLNDKEIEILERKESEMNLQAKFETTVASIGKDNAKKYAELQDQFTRLKNSYFFALALASPAAGQDLNALYERCMREKVPIEQWQDWLVQFANVNQRGEGEEENVENF